VTLSLFKIINWNTESWIPNNIHCKFVQNAWNKNWKNHSKNNVFIGFFILKLSYVVTFTSRSTFLSSAFKKRSEHMFIKGIDLRFYFQDYWKLSKQFLNQFIILLLLLIVGAKKLGSWWFSCVSNQYSMQRISLNCRFLPHLEYHLTL